MEKQRAAFALCSSPTMTLPRPKGYSIHAVRAIFSLATRMLDASVACRSRSASLVRNDFLINTFQSRCHLFPIVKNMYIL